MIGGDFAAALKARKKYVDEAGEVSGEDGHVTESFHPYNPPPLQKPLAQEQGR